MVSMEDGCGENQARFNKYACACAMVASMISIIFGYGTLSLSFPLYIMSDAIDIQN